MDEVYVIYYDDAMFEKSGRKTVYLQKRYAKQVITSEATSYAENEVFHSYEDWYMLNKEEKKSLIDKYKSRFEIKTFVEK